MKKWFIADTHFSHANIIKYTGRPFATVEEMDRVLIDNWNECVSTDDQVFFLGDFGLGDVEHLQSICSQLNGNKVCIRGNHDANPSRMNRIGFPVVLEAAFLKIGQQVAVGTLITQCPPHRSVRAALPHTALILDAWRRSVLQDKDANF